MFRVPPQRHQLELNYFKDWDVWDTVLGNLGLNWQGILWVWWVQGVKQGNCQVTGAMKDLRLSSGGVGLTAGIRKVSVSKIPKKNLVYNKREIGSVFLWLCTPHIRVSVPLCVPHSLAGGSRQGRSFIRAVHSAWQEKGIHSRLLQCRGYPSSSGMGNPLHCSQDWPKVSLLEGKDKEGTDLRLFELQHHLWLFHVSELGLQYSQR